MSTTTAPEKPHRPFLGHMIGIGLIVDTLIVRSFMTPSIAALLGRWFWWPLDVFKILDRYRRPTTPALSSPAET